MAGQPGRIARGKLTIIAGEPGLGKSQLTYALAATVTTGRAWPGSDGVVATSGSVILLSAEDDAADTIRPRLDAAGAEVRRVHVVSSVRTRGGESRRAFNLQEDLLRLESLIERIGDVRMVVIDPISSYLGRVDSHKNAELRAVLEPISDLAARHRVAVLAITHLNKSGSGGANDRVIGSIALVATARAAFIVCRDADDADRRLFLPSKNNIGPGGAGLGFHVVTRSTPSGIVAPAITWDNLPVNVSADQALAIPTRGGRTSARERAIDFLRRNLARGPVATRKAEATAAGISWPSVRRAKDALFERELFGQAPLSEIHGPTLGDRLRDELERLAEAILPLQDRCHRMMIRSLERLPKGARCSSPAK